jgi:hypothetical protein
VHLIVGADELFLLGPNPMITVLSGLEGAVEASSLGISGEEGGVLLRRAKRAGPTIIIDRFSDGRRRSGTRCTSSMVVRSSARTSPVGSQRRAAQDRVVVHSDEFAIVRDQITDHVALPLLLIMAQYIGLYR